MLGVEAGDRAALPAIIDIIVVRARDELRQARRSARQQHERDFIGRRGEAGEDAGVVVAAAVMRKQVAQRYLIGTRVSEHEHPAQRRRQAGHFGGEQSIVVAAPAVGHHITYRIGVGKNVRDFFASMCRQCQHRDHADAQQREQRDDKLDRVGQLEHHAIKRPKSKIDQTAGQPVDRAGELRIGQAPRALHQRDTVGRGGDRAEQHAVERYVSPITLPPVAASRFLGPSCASLQHLPAGFLGPRDGTDHPISLN